MTARNRFIPQKVFLYTYAIYSYYVGQEIVAAINFAAGTLLWAASDFIRESRDNEKENNSL
jgi:hypothetical protein